jgi:acetolactate synthase-1/2/3 large subunit
MSSLTAASQLVRQLHAERVARVFCVPGESYLAVIDALYDRRAEIELISCRHESGAVMMAVASAHLSGRAGVAFVTRGPGATNASIAVHIARQASLPLVLGVGQVARRNRGRESFQEVDYCSYFAPIAKAVYEVSEPDDVAAKTAAAFALAEHGRQGPVVLAFPEDVLSSSATGAAVERTALGATLIDAGELHAVAARLAAAARPMILVGGGSWSDAAIGCVEAFAGKYGIPVFSAFRRADCFDNHHASYAGFLGYGTAPSVWQRVREADCLFVIGSRLDEPTTQDYALPAQGQTLIHVHPDPQQLGLNFPTDVGIAATVETAAAALAKLELPRNSAWAAWCGQAREDYLASEIPPPPDGELDLGAVMKILNARIPDDSIITTDAGNFTAWPLRYRRYARPGRLLAPVNGAMGYGVPAAISAALVYPERTVIGCVGDGGMLMTGMEIATAVKYGASPVILVFNNSKFGTIAMHQQRRYPGRELGNALTNPDFAAFARSFGAFGCRVQHAGEFRDSLEAALGAGRIAVIELVMTATDSA